MGLDQYAFSAKNEEELKKEGGEKTEIAYWRKHPNLQGWMEKLYRDKGGKDEFNCVDIEITSEDLDNLEKAINSLELPETQGFFFGENSDQHYKDEDLLFIEKARKEIENGNKVFYYSWW
jgi:hypothetical protein